MRKFFQVLLTAFFLITTISANDGAFYVSGNNLIPLQETSISLKKEVLKLHVRQHRWMFVEVDFEFYNPEKAKEIIVGFVTPPAEGDVSETDQNHPRLKNFTVTVNGKSLLYKVKKMKETSFSVEKLQIDGQDFVYYFPVKFQKGLNKIRHTYHYYGGGGVELERDFDYQITTGKRWANKQIDDFELQIHLDNGIFAIPARFQINEDQTIFGKEKNLANWQIIGDGVIQEGVKEWFGTDERMVRMVHLNYGYLLFKEKNFKPDYDIFLAEYNWGAGWITRWCEMQAECLEQESLEKIVKYFSLNPAETIEEKEFAELNEKQLKYLRNYFFAVRGVDFKDVETRNFYSQFFWYKPNKNLKTENLRLSKSEKDFITKIQKEEAQRKKFR